MGKDIEMKTGAEVKAAIIKILADSGCRIRPYEGEVSCCVIERPNDSDGWDEIEYLYCLNRHGSYNSPEEDYYCNPNDPKVQIALIRAQFENGQEAKPHDNKTAT